MQDLRVLQALFTTGQILRRVQAEEAIEKTCVAAPAFPVPSKELSMTHDNKASEANFAEKESDKKSETLSEPATVNQAYDWPWPPVPV